jgi:DNA-binding NtrC family response regulator
MFGKILIVDDEADVAKSLMKALERREAKFEILYASNPKDALSITKAEKPELIIIDLTIELDKGPESGLSLLDKLIELDSNHRIIVLTGHSKFEKGIEALNRGALTYLEKPADADLILSLAYDSINIVQLRRESQIKNLSDLNIGAELGFKSNSEKMLKTIAQVEFAIKTNQPVLITGETGTGKGVVARLIHRMSIRKNHPFIRCQPSFSNADLVASELFGHKKGAFTGATEDRKGLIEEANLGTLFIDEIDALPKETQVTLLEVLQEKTFRKLGGGKEQISNFRLISALNRDPIKIIEEGLIRVDFYHRIAHCQIDLPALRERTEDIEDLSQSCLDRLCEKERLDIAFIEHSAISKLKKHSWPGNIRELQAVIEGAAFRASISGRKYISNSDIILQNIEKKDNLNESKSFRERIKLFEEQIVSQSLKEAKGNQAQAAKELQLDRTVFRRILSRISEEE